MFIQIPYSSSMQFYEAWDQSGVQLMGLAYKVHTKQLLLFLHRSVSCNESNAALAQSSLAFAGTQSADLVRTL